MNHARFMLLDWDVSGEVKLDVQQWEVDWDDDNIDDDFSFQLRYFDSHL